MTNPKTADAPLRSDTPYDGRKALIARDHPHAGSVGECMGAEKTLVGWALRFRLTDGKECMVFNSSHVKWLEERT